MTIERPIRRIGVASCDAMGIARRDGRKYRIGMNRKNCEQAMHPCNEGIACRAGETDPLRRDANLSGTAMRQPDSART